MRQLLRVFPVAVAIALIVPAMAPTVVQAQTVDGQRQKVEDIVDELERLEEKSNQLAEEYVEAIDTKTAARRRDRRSRSPGGRQGGRTRPAPRQPQRDGPAVVRRRRRRPARPAVRGLDQPERRAPARRTGSRRAERRRRHLRRTRRAGDRPRAGTCRPRRQARAGRPTRREPRRRTGADRTADRRLRGGPHRSGDRRSAT